MLERLFDLLVERIFNAPLSSRTHPPWYASCEPDSPGSNHPNKTMKPSNQDKAEGAGKKAAGKAKEVTGKATDNERLEAEGRTDQVEGKAQKKAGDVKKVFDK